MPPRSSAPPPTPEPARVTVTEAAADLLRQLATEHGPLMFHQSGGCCDGSSPMCFPAGEFLTGDADVHLGDLAVEGIAPVPVWISAAQYASWNHTLLIIDVVQGRGSGFSLEAPTGQRFLTRSRVFTEAEAEALAAAASDTR